jgi:drug/metabolite transporter (DMT)-like permease
MIADEPERDTSSMAAHEAAIDTWDRPRPRAWRSIAGLGITAAGASTLLPWALAPGPFGPFDDPFVLTDPPALVWIGTLLSAVAIVSTWVRPSAGRVLPVTIVLFGALVVAVTVLGEAHSRYAAPGPMLALAGALLAVLASATRLLAHAKSSSTRRSQASAHKSPPWPPKASPPIDGSAS